MEKNGGFDYADGYGILHAAPALTVCRERLQETLGWALSWGRANGITFDLDKSELQYFHRQHNPDTAERDFGLQFPDATSSGDTPRAQREVILGRKLRFCSHVFWLLPWSTR